MGDPGMGVSILPATGSKQDWNVSSLPREWWRVERATPSGGAFPGGLVEDLLEGSEKIHVTQNTQ